MMFPLGRGLQLWAVIRQQGSINPLHSQSISKMEEEQELLPSFSWLTLPIPRHGKKLQGDQGTGFKAMEGKSG